MRAIVRTACLLLGAAYLLPTSGLAQDWPQWRGPNRDGIVTGVKVPDRWPRALTEEWKVTVGVGCSSPVVAGDRVFVFTRQNFTPQKDPKTDSEKGEEVLLCLDLRTGKEHWRSEP